MVSDDENVLWSWICNVEGMSGGWVIQRPDSICDPGLQVVEV